MSNLKIAIDDVICMEVSKSQDNLGPVEAGTGLRESFLGGLYLLVQVVVEVAANGELHNKAETVVGLEGVGELLIDAIQTRMAKENYHSHSSFTRNTIEPSIETKTFLFPYRNNVSVRGPTICHYNSV